MDEKLGSPRTGRKPIISIRVDPKVLKQAKIGAAIQEKTIGIWLEEAILEKATREKTLHEEVDQ